MPTCIEWVEERTQECTELVDQGQNECSDFQAACCTWAPCSWACAVVQKGLAFGRDWSGTVVNPGSRSAPRDPAPPALGPRWGFGGAARRGANRTEDLSGKVFEEVIERSADACACYKVNIPDHRRAGEQETRCFEAIARHYDVAITFRRNCCRHDGRHRLAATLCARLPGRGGTQEA